MRAFYIFLRQWQLLQHCGFKIVCESNRLLRVVLTTSLKPSALSQGQIDPPRELAIVKSPMTKWWAKKGQNWDKFHHPGLPLPSCLLCGTEHPVSPGGQLWNTLFCRYPAFFLGVHLLFQIFFLDRSFQALISHKSKRAQHLEHSLPDAEEFRTLYVWPTIVAHCLAGFLTHHRHSVIFKCLSEIRVCVFNLNQRMVALTIVQVFPHYFQFLPTNGLMGLMMSIIVLFTSFGRTN